MNKGSAFLEKSILPITFIVNVLDKYFICVVGKSLNYHTKTELSIWTID